LLVNEIVRAGATLGGYRIIRLRGRGAASVVYEAEQIGLGRTVALKVLSAGAADDDAFRERFEREAQVVASLEHPNIVATFDAGHADGHRYLAMQLVEGSDLAAALAAGPWDPWRTAGMLGQVASALDAAHAAGVVHRDVKPANILLAGSGDDERAFLTDFGIARRLDGGPGLTRTGEFVGSVDYVAPEQIRGLDVDGRVDQYSLACVAFRCLSGVAPFSRGTDVATIYAHLDERAPTLTVGGTPWLEGVFERGLAKDPGDRFESCGAFAAAYEAALTDRGPTLARGVVPRVEVVAAPPPTGVLARPARTGRRGALAAAVVALVAVAATIGLALSRNPGPGTSTPPGSAGPSTPPAPGSDALVWQRVERGDTLVRGAGAEAVVDADRAGDTFVAVGHTTTAGDEDAAVWTSTDGRTWRRAGIRAFTDPGAYERILAAAGGGDGPVVAVGWHGIGGQGTDASFWAAPEPTGPWRRTQVDTSPGDDVVYDVVALDDGFLAVGMVQEPGSFDEFDAAAWTSADGVAWDRVDEASFAGPGRQLMRSAVVDGGRILVVGAASPDGVDVDPAAWSFDGGRWERMDLSALAGPGMQQLYSVAVEGDVAVAVGSVDAGTGGVVVAVDDGSGWRPADAPAPKGDEQLNSVIAVDDGFVAGGWWRPDAGIDATVWISRDGTSWRRQPPDRPSTNDLGGPGRHEIRGMLRTDDSPFAVLAFGVSGSGVNEQAAVWAGFRVG
jgi:serine/threonine-protein kinase